MTASSLPGNSRTWSAVQTASATPPVEADGIDLRDVRGFRLSISADAGKFLDGTGTMRALIYEPGISAYVPVPDWDFPIPADSGGTQRVGMVEVPVNVRHGYLIFITDAVTVDAGNINVLLVGYTGPA